MLSVGALLADGTPILGVRGRFGDRRPARRSDRRRSAVGAAAVRGPGSTSPPAPPAHRPMNTPTNAREQLGNAAREEAGRAGAAADDAGDVGRLVVGRRRISSLGLFVAAAAIAPGATTPARAAYESQTQGGLDSPGNAAPAAPASTELSLYKRSFRERFETSISAGTHDYGFKYPKETWKPDIVSLNDGKLYGVDLRFSSPAEGKLCTHVLPFVDADSLTDVGSPEVALDRFVELIGAFWNENGFGVPGGNAGSIKSTKVTTKDKVTYYEYELTKPHNLISAAVTDGQLYIINASAANERQWQQGEANLRNIVRSFYVPP